MQATERTSAVPIDDRFLQRWSPRSFTDQALTEDEVAALFEAARWSPSCFNDQPWLFVYGTKPEDHERIAGLLAEGNRPWAEHAPLLGIVFARKTFARNGKPNRWSPFDSGAAAFALTLQAQSLGLATHFMGGFDEKASYVALGVPEDEYDAMAAFAVGHRGDPAELPDALREREFPSGRKDPSEVAMEGRFTR
jgi:nitroreductase